VIDIDGSDGEGGGQVLRTSLTLSLLVQKPFKIRDIRGRRKNPGLRAQHLAAVRAAQVVGKAEVQGDELGSRTLRFEPSGLRAGEYQFDIGTAGACSLVLQTIFLPLAHTGSDSYVEITGGTHVPWSPSFEYIERVWLPALTSFGYSASANLTRAGFYPKGGGKIGISISGSRAVDGLVAQEQGTVRELAGVSLSSNLPEHVAARQRQRLIERLETRRLAVEIEIEKPESPGQGSAVFISSRNSPAFFGFSALGVKGKRSESVADEAADQVISFIASGAAMDRFLADQVLIPLAIAPSISRFSVETVTEHLRTNAEIIEKFLDSKITIRKPAQGAAADIEIVPENIN
jgi:RNA 3'-phosphate cyclase